MDCVTACFVASSAIARATAGLHSYVRNVHDAREDIASFSAELYALNGVLGLLREDAAAAGASFPALIARPTPGIVDGCTAVVNSLDDLFEPTKTSNAPEFDKLCWPAIRRRMFELRPSLEVYRLALGLALDLMALTSQTSVTSCVSLESFDNALSSLQAEIARVLAEISHLRLRVRASCPNARAAAALQRYLDVLQHHASSWLELAAGPDVNQDADPTPQPTIPIDCFDSLVDEMHGPPHSQPPTPPPRAATRPKRLSRVDQNEEEEQAAMAAEKQHIHHHHHQHQHRNHDHNHDPNNATHEIAPHRHLTNDSTTTSSSQGEDVLGIASPVTPTTSHSSGGGTRFRFFHNRSRSSSLPAHPSAGRPSTALSGSDKQSSRSHGRGRRLVVPWKTNKESADEEIAALEPDAVFGVSLRKSIRIAGTTARTRHTGNQGASKRQFPLSVFKCYQFLARQVETPELFGRNESDSVAVRQLRVAFSAPPDYGANIDLVAVGCSPHDAAALVLTYLSELSRPLVSEAMVRRWVTLSQQATQSGAAGRSRPEEGLDFWTEALGGGLGSLGGGNSAQARNLLKLLLNLWGDIAEAADHNEMTAERLAGCVLRPLTHARVADSRRQTDYMLALAFVIRRRSEYGQLLRGSGRQSRAAFEA